jgi:two-component system response regulator AtoC
MVDVSIRFTSADFSVTGDDVLQRLGRSALPILICGETGTGKELLARAIHRQGGLSQGRFAAIDCGALPASLIEAELFGYVKGAFTGAESAKIGLLACAEGGTIFLDEIGELPLELQPKLLRVLQEHEIRPLGSLKTVPILARIIAATNRNLEEAVAQGSFRRDLYYRLNAVTLTTPPLRERRADIAAISESILDQVMECGGRRISAEALCLMQAYDWPGNIRELESCLRRIVALKPDDLVIEARDLPPRVRNGAECLKMVCRENVTSLYEIEKSSIFIALKAAAGNKIAAAKSLGIGKTTLYRKLKQYRAEIAKSA